MSYTQITPVVQPYETIKERYVIRRWLGIFTYEVCVSSISQGYDILIFSPDEQNLNKVVVNGKEYLPITNGR